MIVYHATASDEALKNILENGFTDAVDTYGTTSSRKGVWLSDRPLAGGEGGLMGFEPLLRLELPEDVIREYEWTDESGNATYREWLVPAGVVNRYPREFVGDSFEVPAPDDGRVAALIEAFHNRVEADRESR
jgi:hypothetical protein